MKAPKHIEQNGQHYIRADIALKLALDALNRMAVVYGAELQSVRENARGRAVAQRQFSEQVEKIIKRGKS